MELPQEEEWDDAILSEISMLETSHLQRRQTPNLSENRSNQATMDQTSDQWSCHKCTLLNAATLSYCAMCKTPRSGQNSVVSKGKVQSTLSFGGSSRRPPPRPGPSQAPKRSLPTKPIASKSPALQSIQPVNLIERPRQAQREDPIAAKRYLDISPGEQPHYDATAIHKFVYPTNYQVRDYQLNISERSLYHNTLVTLPTGLGKTLIASVVMYNFYKWFPQGQIVFMAPTKPLVAQQIRACHEIMGIDTSETAQLQGNVPPATRAQLWRTKRVFFCTPQSLQNDVEKGRCLADRFVCLVVDEAHRATGNYAYCNVIKAVESQTRTFRVLALSATPGAKYDVIQDVIKNLRISHVECRNADDVDVKRFTHARQEEVVKCGLTQPLTELKTAYLKVIARVAQRLALINALPQKDPDKLNRWFVLQRRQAFRESSLYASNRGAEADFALLVSLVHARDLLTIHGLSSFQEYVQGWIDEQQTGRLSWSKKDMFQSEEFKAVQTYLSDLAGPSEASRPENHPKFAKLKEILLEHFRRHDQGGHHSTRAIVFTQYRASVSEIVKLLKPLSPMIRVQPFIGQGQSGKGKDGKGMSQKLQQEIVHKFRQGEFNVLTATCIAEEGLDIGDVDLIVSFDALTSPVRMIQRMGRTGRKRVGRVVVLVTEGDEEKKLQRSERAAKSVSKALTMYKSKFEYCSCARMVPEGICPELSELRMEIPEFHASQVAGKGPVLEKKKKSLTWRLTEMEEMVGRARFFPEKMDELGRKAVFPLMTNSFHLCKPREYVVGKKSTVLQDIVRQIRGVDVSEEENKVEDVEVDADEYNSPIVEESQGSFFQFNGFSDVVTMDEAEAENKTPVHWTEPTPTTVQKTSAKKRKESGVDASVLAQGTALLAELRELASVETPLVSHSPEGNKSLNAASPPTHTSPRPDFPRISLPRRLFNHVDTCHDGNVVPSPPKQATENAKASQESAVLTPSASPIITRTQDVDCSVCGEKESYEEDVIVLCDGCNVAVHQHCYGLSFVPTDEWFCDFCEQTKASKCQRDKKIVTCALCPIRGGAVKKTECGHWVHVQCFLWIPELSLTYDTTGVHLGSLQALDSDRKDLKCVLCHSSREHGIIQCAYKQCLVAFHVSCGFAAAEYSFRQQAQAFQAYCPQHKSRQDPSQVLWSPLSLRATQETGSMRKFKRLRRGEKKKKSPNKKRKRNLFVEEEAEVDGSVQCESQEEEEEAFSDSFIDDNTHMFSPSQTQVDASMQDMRAVYTRSLRESPDFLMKGIGKGVFPTGGIIESCMRDMPSPNLTPIERNLNDSWSQDVPTPHEEMDSVPSFEMLPSREEAKETGSVDRSHAPSFELLSPPVTKRKKIKHVDTTSAPSFALMPPPKQSPVQSNRDAPPSFALLPSPEDEEEKKRRMEANRLEALAKLKARQQARQQPKTVVWASTTFANSSVVQNLKGSGGLVELDDRLEADLLLSTKTAVKVLQAEKVVRLGKSVLHHPDVAKLSQVFQKLVVVVEVGQFETQLQTFVNVHSPGIEVVAKRTTVEVTGRLMEIAKAEQEFGISRRTVKTQLDEHFWPRVDFFQRFPSLSTGSILSLSFRFRNFTVDKIPVKKLNAMHWKRMLPWISDASAKQLVAYF